MSSAKNKVINRYIKYVSQNVLGMIGISAYILADTFFISKSQGGNGITALNLVLPVYSLIYAVGAMLGVGSAIRYSITKVTDSKKAAVLFFHALLWALLIGVCFMLLGGLFPAQIIALLGGDAVIISVGTSYLRIVLLFAPCFMWNHICNAFVRNDKNPSLAMLATLLSTIFNIVMDYVFMFPLGMGMAGAALATALSPIVGVLVCCLHFFSGRCSIKICPCPPSVKKLVEVCQLGVAAFVSEISSGITTTAFNFVILGLSGNVGVAAYGVVANTALVAVSIFNGIAQGAQPLLSDYYGRRDKKSLFTVMRLTICTAIGFAMLIAAGVFVFAPVITDIFNSEKNAMLSSYAILGLRIYFTGFLFAGVNIVGGGILSAVEDAKGAFFTSIARGFVFILACAFLLPRIWGMTGVWLAFPTAEFLTLLITIAALAKRDKWDKY